MFTFLVQSVDLFAEGLVRLFLVFFLLSWGMYFYKKYTSEKFENGWIADEVKSVSVIIPVVDEDPKIWRKVLEAINRASFALDCEKIVVANGKHSDLDADIAKKLGFRVERVPEPNKRIAVARGAEIATKNITVILDSDTIVSNTSLYKIARGFSDWKIGGITPRHEIFERGRSIARRISDWMEDIRFTNTVRGQSYHGCVSCLPGRMLAIRTDLLKKAIPEFLNQKFLNQRCVTGDDRFLTSWLLKNGYDTIYQEHNVVSTDAPDSLTKFAKQRLRWARSSLRESLMSIIWIWKRPYMAFTVFGEIFMRIFFVIVIFSAILTWSGLVERDHYVWNLFPSLYNFWFIVGGVVLGFFVSGMLRQLPHLKKYPEDWKYLPIFLIVTTFVLFPIEIVGGATCYKNGWMTRKC
jgi:hyaluronan synthase